MNRRATGADALVAVVIAATTVIVALATPEPKIDDAYITYRYAHNLAHHGQLVWNLGEFVEGQTNLLWSLLLAGFAALTGASVAAIAGTLGLAITAATAVVLFVSARRLGLATWLAGLLTLAFQLTPAAIGFSVGGLESGLVALLTALVLHAYLCERQHQAAVCAGLLFTARPDAALLAVTLAVLDLLYSRSVRQVVRDWWPALLIGLGTEAFRLAYYGALVPNSVVAKSLPLSRVVGDVWRYHSHAYLTQFLLWPPAWLFIGASLLGAWSNRRDEGGRAARLGSVGGLVLVAAVALVARNGGDWMRHFRLISQYYPAYAISLAVFLSAADRRSLARPRVAALLLLGVPLVFSLPESSSQWSFERAARAREQAGIPPFYESLVQRLEPIDLRGLTLASEAAGFALYSLPEVRGHDPMGILDPWIARHGEPEITFGKKDMDYTFFEVTPDIAAFHSSAHLGGVSNLSALLDRYHIRCFAECTDRSHADLVLLHRQLPATVRAAFADVPSWTPDFREVESRR